MNVIPNILNEEDIDVVFEIISDKDFEKSDTEIETYESIELKYPQQYEDGAIIILDDFNEKEMKDPRVQAMFQGSRHNLSFYNQSGLLWVTKMNYSS